jgi:hypothetical protein
MLNKNIIKDALADAKEIEKFAIEQARKSLEEALMPQIEKAIQESLQENTTVESIEVNGIDTTTISESVESSENLISENTNSQNIQEMYNEKEETNEELFEVEGLFEEEETAQEPAEASLEAKLDAMTAKLDTLIAAAQGGGEEEASAEGEVEVVDDEAAAEAPAAPAEPAAAPAPAAPAAPAPAEQPTVTEDTMFEIEMEEDLEEGLFEIEMEEDMEEGIEEGDKVYEINVDEDMEEEVWKKVEEDMEEEGLYEIDMEEDITEGEMEEEGLKKVEEDMEEEGLYEIDMEEGDMEESRSLAFSSKNRGPRYNHNNLPKHAPVTTPAKGLNESKIKTQHESKIDELIKENVSLKGVIKNYKSNLKEFENSFVELKSQLNEMQTFNGKLAYANKLLTKGGLTNDEKIRIAEEFDKCATVEDAKKLYNKIISENKFSSKPNTDKLKSVKPSTASVQNLSENKAEKLFESEERRRMKMLAGIVKPNN